MQILGASDSGGQAQIREAQDFFANSAAHAIRDSWVVLCDSRLGTPGCSEMLYRASPDSPVRPGAVLARLRLRLASNSDRGTNSTSCARMSELLPVYRRSVCVSPAVVGVENGISEIRTADVTTSHAGARSTPAGFVA